MGAVASVEETAIECDESRRRLAIAHMNRGHALMARGVPALLDAALTEYDEAIRLLGEGAAGADESWRNSLGAAWLNRGQLLHFRHGIAHATDAIEALDRAEEILSSLPPGSPWPRRNRIGTALNRANLLLDLHQPAEARAVAQQAIAWGRSHENESIEDALLAVKSRRAQCDAIGRLLVVDGADQPALADEATDLVDDALALGRRWASHAPAYFEDLQRRLFRYGTELYRVHQPHFLAEFIRENCGLSAPIDFVSVARAATATALQKRPSTPWLTVGDAASERFAQTARDLEALRRELGER